MPARGAGEIILTKKQLAQKLGRSERWIELQVRDNKMPVLEATDRYGRRRYSLQAVEAWLEGGKPKGVKRQDRLAALERQVADLQAQLNELRRAS
jgi:predicted  nucleic acid-binding Zn-ribbon protein